MNLLKNFGLVSVAFFAFSALASTQDGAQRADGVVVLPPPSLSQTGTLRVNSVAAYNQSIDFMLVYCKTDSSGNLLNSGCQEDLETEKTSDQDLTIAPGLYQLEIGASLNFVHVVAGQRTVVNLQPIAFPESSLPMHVDVYLDVTNEQMRDLALQNAFGNSSSKATDDLVCSGPLSGVPDVINACKAMNSSNYRDLLNAIFKFNPDGTVSQLQSDDEFKNIGRLSVGGGDVPAGTSSVAAQVFPGVYIVKYTNPATGEATDQFGVTVTDTAKK